MKKIRKFFFHLKWGEDAFTTHVWSDRNGYTRDCVYKHEGIRVKVLKKIPYDSKDDCGDKTNYKLILKPYPYRT